MQTLLTALGVGVFGLPVLVVLVLVLLARWPPLINHTAAARMDTSTGTAVLRSAALARGAGRRERAGRYATGTADRQPDRQSLHLHTSQQYVHGIASSNDRMAVLQRLPHPHPTLSMRCACGVGQTCTSIQALLLCDKAHCLT